MTSVHATRTPSTSRTSRQFDTARVPGAYGVLLLVLAGVLLLNSVLGPLVLNVVSYPITDSMENQLIGLELVTAFLVAPWAALAGLAALRGHPASPILGFAPSAYAAYMFVQYILGPEYTRYSITALAQLAIFVLATALMLASWSLSRQVTLPPMRAAQATRSGLLLFALAAFVLLRYSGAVVGAFTGAHLEGEFADDRTFFWSIFLLDLGIVVPCTVAAGLALLRGAAAGQRALYAVVGWFALVPPSVAAMAAVMWARNDPHASVPTVLMLSVVALAFGTFAWHTVHPLLTGRVGTGDQDDR
jgi:hypothetical protein